LTHSQQEIKGAIFDIQRYSIHDGPGIRTVVFFKGCPLKCPWCSNPEAQNTSEEIEYSRMDCFLCLCCVDACSERALTHGEEGIHVDREKCSLCGKCVEVCLSGGIRQVRKMVTVEEVLQIVEKDRAFYESSGGGITLSGGEPLSQHEFASSLLQASKQRGLHTCIETTGYQQWKHCLQVIRYADTVLFDLKIWNPASHRKIVGVSNEMILKNARKIVELGKELIIRVPLIPGYNDNPENLGGFVGFARQIGVAEMHLLPYHRLGESKYDRLGRSYPLKDLQPPTREEMNKVGDELTTHGIKIQIGG
jgi:pyruvate formate lyase activating enzyme